MDKTDCNQQHPRTTTDTFTQTQKDSQRFTNVSCDEEREAARLEVKKLINAIFDNN